MRSMWRCANCGEYFHSGCRRKQTRGGEAHCGCAPGDRHSRCFTYADVFAGSGMFAYQLHVLLQLGRCRPFHKALAIECEPQLRLYSCALECLLRGAQAAHHVKFMADLFTHNIPGRLDLATVGVPCCLFSKNRTGSRDQGQSEELMRDLLDSLALALERKLWSVVVIECVSGFFTHPMWLEGLRPAAMRAAYTVLETPLVINTSHLGEEQARVRSFMVLHMHPPARPIECIHSEIMCHMRALPSSVTRCLLTTEEHLELGLTPECIQAFSLQQGSPQHRKLLSLFEDHPVLTLHEAEGHWPPLVVDLSNSRAWTVVRLDAVCPTLTRSHGYRSIYVLHQDYRRFLTPFEHMRVMGFAWPQLKAAAQTLTPHEIGKLAGNAVSAKSVECVLLTVFQAFPALFLGARVGHGSGDP